jgi:hypothetical protein
VLGQFTPQKPLISFRDYAAWFETHVVAHQRGAIRDRSILNQLRIHFNRFDSIADIDAHSVEEWKTARKKQVKPANLIDEFPGNSTHRNRRSKRGLSGA